MALVHAMMFLERTPILQRIISESSSNEPNEDMSKYAIASG